MSLAKMVADNDMKTILCVLLYINGLGITNQQLNGTKQVFNITCDPLSNETTECQNETLESIAVLVQQKLDLVINLKISTLKLCGTVDFNNLSSLTISGTPGLTTIACCTSEGNSTIGAGILLRDISGTLTLENLNLSFCGSLFKNWFSCNETFSSALTIIQCKDVEINRLVIGRSEGVGLVILNHLGGKVNIRSSIFAENKLPQRYYQCKQLIQGGGGIYIQLGQFLPIPYSPMTLHFHNCTFDSNVAHTKYYLFHFTDIMGNVLKGYGMGGGVSVTIKKGISNVFLSFSECLFVSNQAFFGAGLSVRAYRRRSDSCMSNVTVEIKHSVIKENGCSRSNHAYYGGGVHLSFSTMFYRSVIRKSHYLMNNVSFTRNCAELGGGVHYFSDLDRHDTCGSVNSSMVFQNCTFKQNEAFTGSAIFLSPNIIRKLSTGYTVIVPTIKDSRFLENLITVRTRPSQQGSQSVNGRGTVYSSRYSFQLQGYNHFESNWGSAMHVVDGVVNLQSSSATFINNTGPFGGALALIGSSRMIVGPNSYSFINNTALYEGGALYILLDDITDFLTSRSCFIQYQDGERVILSGNWSSNITFTGNEAMGNKAGHAIFATSLYPCQLVSTGINNRKDYTIIENSKVFDVRGMTFDDDPLLQPQISTDGGLLYGSKPLPLRLFPGREYAHGVVVRDDIGQTVEVTFISTINRNAQNITTDSPYANDKVCLRGEPTQNSSLYLKTMTHRGDYITLEVSLLECPPGFKLSDNKECVCNTEAYVGLIKCDMENFHSHLIHGYWVGLLNSADGSNLLVTCGCPFCDYSSGTSNASEFEVVLPQSHSELDKTVCGETRTGVLCGKCQEGYTAHFHSPSFLCKPTEPVGCKLGWLFYILLELVPVTVVFIGVLVLNISCTSGGVNGFIFFSQVIVTMDIDASGIVAFPDDSLRNSIWTEGYHIIYGLFNLDAFNCDCLSFCLWESASVLDMLVVKYITILYSLLLIVVVIFILNKWGGRCCGKYCRITTVKNSVVHGISSFLVLCYAQCVKISLNLLTPAFFHTEENSGFRVPPRVWLNGELSYYGGKHLFYAVPAMFILCVIGLLLPAVLLAYPMLNRCASLFFCENIKFCKSIMKKGTIVRLKPLLDSIQGCFKDDFRFFAGLYFLYRWVFQLLYMVKGFSLYYVGVGIFTLFILVLHSICQPYVKRLHNIIDALLLVDLALINILGFYTYHVSHNHRDLQYVIVPVVVQLVLIYLPLAVMCVYLLVLLCKWCKYKCWFCPVTASCIFESHRCKFVRKLVDLVKRVRHETDSNDETYDRSFDESYMNTHAYHRAGTEIAFDTYP